MTAKITGWVLISVGIALIVYDVFASATGYNWTITNLMRGFVRNYPISGFGIGAVTGWWCCLARQLIKQKDVK